MGVEKCGKALGEMFWSTKIIDPNIDPKYGDVHPRSRKYRCLFERTRMLHNNNGCGQYDYRRGYRKYAWQFLKDSYGWLGWANWRNVMLVEHLTKEYRKKMKNGSRLLKARQKMVVEADQLIRGAIAQLRFEIADAELPKGSGQFPKDLDLPVKSKSRHVKQFERNICRWCRQDCQQYRGTNKRLSWQSAGPKPASIASSYQLLQWKKRAVDAGYTCCKDGTLGCQKDFIKNTRNPKSRMKMFGDPIRANAQRFAKFVKKERDQGRVGLGFSPKSYGWYRSEHRACKVPSDWTGFWKPHCAYWRKAGHKDWERIPFLKKACAKTRL